MNTIKERIVVKIQNRKAQRLEQNLAKILSLQISSLCIYRLLEIWVAIPKEQEKHLVLPIKYTLKTEARKIEVGYFS